MFLILRLNWPMYVKAAVLATLGLILSRQFEGGPKLAVLLAVAATTFWAAASLAASWWIYDRSRIYELHWLNSILDQAPGSWLNLHNGLDEIDPVLRMRYPSSAGQTLDIFDPNEMTEPSIREARRCQLDHPIQRQANWRYLPAANQTYDAVFIVFTAHEFRRPAARERLFIEVQRVLRDSGRIVLVEHLRDWNNFAVFGPGSLHFQSRQAWIKATRPAGLRLLNDRRITPFVHAFVFEKTCERKAFDS
jgi:SAM-dependent methyltransferase